MKRVIDFNEAMRPIRAKLGRHKLTRGDMVLLLIDKILNPSWGSARLTDLPYEPIPTETNPKKILVIQTSSIGDVVYTTPALMGLRERYPASSISILTSEIPGSVVIGNPDIDEAFFFPKERCLKDLRGGGKDFWRVISEVYLPIKQLQFKRFDLVLNLSVTPMSAFLTRLVGGERISGLTVDDSGRPKVAGCLWCPYTFYIKANRPMQDLCRLDLMELHLRMADTNPSKRELIITVNEEIIKRCHQNLSNYGVSNGELLIGLNPGAGFRSRCWPMERFAQLGDRLKRGYGARIIIFGGPKEEDLAREIVGLMESRDTINLAGKTSLKEMAAYLERCDHLITNDTGAMHIAAAMKTPVIGICGPTLVGPLGKEGHLLLQADLDCIGCGTTSLCTKGDCMRAIPVEAVLAALRYQRAELKEPPEIDGVKIFAAGDDEPGRLFFYQTVNKGKENVEDEILRLLYLNLWIRENNRLGFYPEEEIGIEEMESGLARRFSQDEIAAGIKRGIERLKGYETFCNEAMEYLGSLKDEGSLSKYKMVADRLYDGVGRFFSLYDFLYPDSSSGLARSLRLCQIKSGASLYMVNFLEEWRKTL